jgi:hypothetical protein
VKDADNVLVAATVIVLVVLFWPEVFITVNVTAYEPADAKAWLGF